MSSDTETESISLEEYVNDLLQEEEDRSVIIRMFQQKSVTRSKSIDVQQNKDKLHKSRGLSASIGNLLHFKRKVDQVDQAQVVQPVISKKERKPKKKRSYHWGFTTDNDGEMAQKRNQKHSVKLTISRDNSEITNDFMIKRYSSEYLNDEEHQEIEETVE
eukprot:202745_1